MSDINLLVQESILDQPFIQKEFNKRKNLMSIRATKRHMQNEFPKQARVWKHLDEPSRSIAAARDSALSAVRRRSAMGEYIQNTGHENYINGIIKKRPALVAAGKLQDRALSKTPTSMKVDPPSAASDKLKLDILSNPKSHFNYKRR